MPDTPQPIPVGEEALTDSAPEVAPGQIILKSVGNPHSSEGEGAESLADPRIHRRLKWAE